MYFRKFFDNEGVGDGGGVVDAPAEVVPPVDDPPPPPENVNIPLSVLKEWGFDSVEQATEHFAKAKSPEPTEEEKKKAQEIENADFRAYAIKGGLMKEDDFKLYDKVTGTTDRDLVFENFFQDFKEANTEIEEDEMEEAAQEAFDAEYRTASEKRIKREADMIRRDSIKAFNDAKEDYKDNVAWEGGKNKWTAFVAKTIEAALPGEDLKFFAGKDGDNEINIAIKLTKEEKAEIAKQVLTPKRYAQFLEGKEDEVAKTITQRVVSAAQQKYLPKAIEMSIQEGIKIGKTRGSFVGSTNPFPIASRAVETQQVEASVGDALKEIRESYKNTKGARGG